MVYIVTDTAADMEGIQDPRLKTIAMNITMNGQDFKAGQDLNADTFYSLLPECEVLPKTSQPSPGQYMELLDALAEEPDFEGAVVITISSRLSGTYQSAMLAAQGKDNVFVVDSLNASLGEQVLVRRALELAKEGRSAAEIAQILDEEKQDIRLVALVDTLEYLQKGGRLSRSAAAAGTLLKIKPVIGIENGEVVVLGKARGLHKGMNLLTKNILEAGGIDGSRPYVIGYTGQSSEQILQYAQDCHSLWPQPDTCPDICQVGPTIGVHCGPNAMAAAWFAPRS